VIPVKTCKHGDAIVREVDVGECMYVIVSGKAEVLKQQGAEETCLAVLGPGDFFGEMAIFDRETRSATVRAKGDVKAMPLNKVTLQKRIVEDPYLALRILEKMSKRIRELDRQVVAPKKADTRSTRGRKTRP
jgi:CRP/FNR family cyclic AMP-dependent transcriptional regulator